jgi:subtilisin family serine protease
MNALNLPNRTIPTIAALVALAGLAVAVPADAAGSRPIPGRYIVVLADGALEAPELGFGAARSIGEVAGELAANRGGRATRRFGHALSGFVFEGDAEAAADLSRDPRVVSVEPDYTLELAGSQNPPSWGLDRVDQRDKVLDSTYFYNADGTGIDLYVIDTGIRSSHQDFGNRVDVANGYDGVGDGYGTEDCNGHGTHVAGIAGSGTYGVAKNLNLIPVRILNCGGGGSTSGLIAAIDWITAKYPAGTKKAPKGPTRAVANISVQAPWTYALDYAVEKSIQAGVTYVVAAGNGATDACLYSPARAQTAIKVGATDVNDNRAAWSNFGTCVDLFAPGSSITSTYIRNDADAVAMSGTSMAAPHVAGTVALMLSVNPAMRPSDVKAILIETSTKGGITYVGDFTPNRLLYSEFAGNGEDLAPLPSFYWTCSGQDCRFDATSTADDWGILAYAWDFGDGRTGSGSKPTHRYRQNAGSLFVVTLTVTDTNGQQVTLQKEVRTAW